MKTTKSLARAQRAMRKRQQSPRPAGRPRLPISSLELLELWAGGYSPRGMAIRFGCNERTIAARLAEVFPNGPSLSFLSDRLLYQLAMHSDNPRPLIFFLRRQERREYRRTGMHADERFLIEVMEYQFQQRRKLAEEQEKIGEMDQVAEKGLKP